MADKFDFENLIDKKRNDKPFVIFFAFVIIVLLLSSIFNFKYGFVPIAGSSMENTFHNGDVVLVSINKKASYGDVVIIKDEKVDELNGKIYSYLIIKRVIAIGGDTVKFKDGNVYLKKSGETDFNILQEDYIKEPNSTFYPFADDDTCIGESEEIFVPQGEYFYLGDNRTNSRDSRTTEYSTCKKSQIVGVVTNGVIKNKRTITNFYYFAQRIYAFFGI